ncbi:ANTAR domain-containing protein [Streptomyces nodosus]
MRPRRPPEQEFGLGHSLIRGHTMAFSPLSTRYSPHLLSATDLARENERLQEENAQLRRAMTSHATIDQAMGAVVVLGQLAPEEAWRVLRAVSQHTNTKLRVVAEHILKFARGGSLPGPEREELRQELDRFGVRSGKDPSLRAP